MAAISYWFLSPSVILALIGKLKGWDRTKPTPTFDWRTATLDVVVPAKNEESSIALCLASLFDQDFRIRRVTVIDDGSTDQTAKVVQRYPETLGGRLELVALPTYAPDLNPDEFVWSHMKKNGVSKKPLRKNESLRERVEEDLANIHGNRRLVRSFFCGESVVYAKD